MANLSSTRIFGDGTVERSLYVKQRLGVGVGSPSAKLDVDGIMRVVPGDDQPLKVQSGTSGDELIMGGNEIEATGSLYIQNDSGNETYFTGGNVGIGTTSPSQKLDVQNGHINLKDGYSLGWGGSRSTQIDTNVSIDNLRFIVTGTEAMNIRGSGNVGIGTTSPSDKLEVNGSIRVDQNSYIDFRSDTNQMINLWGDGPDADYGIGVQNSTQYFRSGGGNFAWFDGGTHSDSTFDAGGGSVDMVLNSGDLGIGTTSPNQKLDVEGAVDVNGRLNMRGNDINDVRRINGDNGNHRIRFDDNNSYIEFSDQSNNRRQVVARDVYIDEDNYWIGSLNLENHVNDSNAHHSRYTDSEASQISGSSVSKNIDGTGSGAPNARGYQVSWDSDFAFFGLVDLGNDNKHVAIANEQQSDDFKFYSAAANIVTITGGGTIRADGDVVAFYSSDRRLKKNPTQVENPMTKIEKLTGVGFGWKEKASREGKGFGIFAQDAKKIDDRLVRKQGDGYLGVDYQQLHGIEIEALKQINEKVEENQSEIQRLKQRIAKLESNDNAI